MLAEYLVACAVGSRGRPRVDWDAYDVLTPRQERIEVKSAAYLQAWEQRRESAIIFRGLRARSWNPREGYSGGLSYNADVYVFAVLTATEHVGATGGHAGAVTTTWSPVIRVPATRVLVLVANFSGPRPGAPPDLVTSSPTLWGRPLPHDSGIAGWHHGAVWTSSTAVCRVISAKGLRGRRFHRVRAVHHRAVHVDPAAVHRWRRAFAGRAWPVAW